MGNPSKEFLIQRISTYGERLYLQKIHGVMTVWTDDISEAIIFYTFKDVLKAHKHLQFLKEEGWNTVRHDKAQIESVMDV